MIRPLLLVAVILVILLGAFAAPLPGRADHNLEHTCEQFYAGEFGEQVPLEVLTECGSLPAPDSGESSQPEQVPPEQPEQVPAEPEQVPAGPERVPAQPEQEPADAAQDAGPPSAGEPDIVGVFFGTEGAGALLPRVAEIMQCPYLGLQYQENRADNCPGILDAFEAAGAYSDGFLEEFPNPSQLERDLSRQITTAIFLAGLNAKGGQPLFPSVGPALELIAKLADKRTLYTLPGQDPVSVVERFVGLLAARDAAGWEKRFP